MMIPCTTPHSTWLMQGFVSSPQATLGSCCLLRGTHIVVCCAVVSAGTATPCRSCKKLRKHVARPCWQLCAGSLHKKTWGEQVCVLCLMVLPSIHHFIPLHTSCRWHARFAALPHSPTSLCQACRGQGPKGSTERDATGVDACTAASWYARMMRHLYGAASTATHTNRCGG